MFSKKYKELLLCVTFNSLKRFKINYLLYSATGRQTIWLQLLLQIIIHKWILMLPVRGHNSKLVSFGFQYYYVQSVFISWHESYQKLNHIKTDRHSLQAIFQRPSFRVFYLSHECTNSAERIYTPKTRVKNVSVRLWFDSSFVLVAVERTFPYTIKRNRPQLNSLLIYLKVRMRNTSITKAKLNRARIFINYSAVLTRFAMFRNKSDRWVCPYFDS